MNKILTKLFACLAALVIAASLMVVSTYAWLTMSSAPDVAGMQIRIGGKNTILIAADCTVENEDGTVSHYPGAFAETLDFAEHGAYDYLKEVSGLLPVSTTDGIHWVLPDYYDLDDEMVTSGQAVNGELKDTSAFMVDDTLYAANLEQLPDTVQGHYVYLDFWVVAPGADYQLRVSSGDGLGTGGSYVIQLPDVKKQAETYVLTDGNTAANAVRIGFLTNSQTASDSDLRNYMRSEAYSDQFSSQLRGRYAAKGQSAQDIAAEENRFTIYEPNGNLHEDGSGEYYITSPLRVADGEITASTVSDRLTVQMENTWKLAANGTQTMLQQQFVTAIAGKDLSKENEQSLQRYFYQERLQSLMAPYLTPGGFVTQTQALYRASQYGKVSADNENLHMTGGATEDVYITTLERDIPQRIRMFIWIEGQDVDCIERVQESNFAISLELAGSNQY